MKNLIRKHVWIVGFFLLLSCTTNKTPKDDKMTMSKELSEGGDLEWVEILEGVYGIPADSVEILKEMAKVRSCYSFKDMVTDYGQLDWYNKEDDPFDTEHLMCEEDMLDDSLMYRLVDNLICSHDYYEGELKAAYEWLWHDEMLTEIDTYLKTKYADEEEFDDDDYLQVFNDMYEYVSPLACGNNPEMRQCAQVWCYISDLVLIGKYKEAILYSYPSKELAKAYLDDYHLWKKVFQSVVEANRPEHYYRYWSIEYYSCGEQMATFRAEMLDEEIAFLNGEKSMKGVTPEERRKYRRDIKELDLWYDMRKMVGEDVELPWYSHITYKICNDYWEKEISEWPKL